MKKLSIILASVLLAGIAITSCVKKEFDNPPDVSSYDPQLPVNMSIMALRKMKPYTGSANDTMLITQDYTIAGIVNADDRSGNLYKSIYIQDSSGGIQLNIDAYSLFANYPVGRRIYVKLKGLYLSYSGATGTPSLSGSIDEQGGVVGIAGAAIADHIIKGSTGNLVKDTVISFAQARTYSPLANERLLCRLVTIADSVQFADTLRPYTDPTAATNRYITQCGSNLYVGNTAPAGTMAVRTDNYAHFHAQKLPYGKGTISGIYTIFKTTPQLIIRDTTDVKFYGPRCGVTTPTLAPVISIDSVRKLYPGTGTYAFPTSVRITGVVISDIDNKNVSSGNFIIEDGSQRGITLFISGSSAYKLGDSVSVDLSNATMKVYVPTGQTVGSLEIDGLTVAKVTKVGSGKSVAPITVTISQLNNAAGIARYESVLVKIANAAASGGATYSGNRTLTDATGTMSLFTSSTAAFASQTLPIGTKTFVGIATPYSPNNEIKLRDPAIDVY